jgi:hypothetical protein
MNVAVEKTSSLTKEDASNLKEIVSLMTKFLTKEDALKLKENLSIVTKEDVSIEKKNTMQKEDASTLKKSHTNSVLTATTVASDEQGHEELNVTALASHWLKSVLNNLK